MLGYEEALGYSTGEVVRDKDGISAAVVFTELVAALEASGSSVEQRLDDLAAEHGVHLTAQWTRRFEGVDGVDRMASSVERLRSEPPAVLGDVTIDTVEDLQKPRLSFDKADDIANRVAQMYEDGEFDVCTLIYARFRSAITQIVTRQQLIPFAANAAEGEENDGEAADAQDDAMADFKGVYEYEPSEEEILAELLPRNLAVQIFKALLENNASEQGARMTAMDNATRNAGEMIDKLTLTYNRTRQAVITKELIEIVSAKEAM